jgi:hypothetical protein
MFSAHKHSLLGEIEHHYASNCEHVLRFLGNWFQGWHHEKIQNMSTHDKGIDLFVERRESVYRIRYKKPGEPEATESECSLNDGLAYVDRTIRDIQLSALQLQKTWQVVHAAGLATEQKQGTIVAGESGSGKSTLAVASTNRGLRLLADEYILLAENGTMWGYPRPIEVIHDLGNNQLSNALKSFSYFGYPVPRDSMKALDTTVIYGLYPHQEPQNAMLSHIILLSEKHAQEPSNSLDVAIEHLNNVRVQSMHRRDLDAMIDSLCELANLDKKQFAKIFAKGNDARNT